MAERIVVTSSDIAAVSYDADTRTLTVEFKRGKRTYAYDAVPLDVYRAFVAAPSKGKFFHENIKDKYEYREMKNGY